MPTPGSAITLAVKDGAGNAQTLEGIVGPDSVSIETVHAEDAAQRSALIAALAPPIAPVSSPALSGSLVIAATATVLMSVDCVTTNAAGWLLLFNATTVPADGAVAPVKAYQIPANTTFRARYDPGGLAFNTGCVAVFSTTGPFTKTANASAFLSSG